MIRWLTILGLCAAAGALLCFLALRGRPAAGPDQASSTESAAPSAAQRAVAPATPAATTSVEATTGASSVAEGAATTFPATPVAPATPFLLGSADKPPAMEPVTVLGNMRIAIHQYGSRFGGNPVGTNPEITKALNGENPREVRFINEDSGLRINARGELVDYWGTPFFFHQLSGSEMEIRSAGPDRVMWTADDLVTK